MITSNCHRGVGQIIIVRCIVVLRAIVDICGLHDRNRLTAGLSNTNKSVLTVVISEVESGTKGIAYVGTHHRVTSVIKSHTDDLLTHMLRLIGNNRIVRGSRVLGRCGVLGRCRIVGGRRILRGIGTLGRGRGLRWGRSLRWLRIFRSSRIVLSPRDHEVIRVLGIVKADLRQFLIRNKYIARQHKSAFDPNPILRNFRNFPIAGDNGGKSDGRQHCSKQDQRNKLYKTFFHRRSYSGENISLTL